MADYVKFTKEGLLEYRWNSETRQYDSEVPTNNLVNLRSWCKIDEGVTLGDIFAAVEKDSLLTDFINFYSWCWAIRDFHEQAKLPRPDKEDSDKLQYIELKQYGNYNTMREKSFADAIHRDTSFHLDVHMSAVSESGETYTISYTPMNEVAHLPVRLNDHAVIRKNFVEDFFETYTCFSLIEVLDAIYFDISFHGGPDDNKRFLEELHEQITEIKEGRAELVPFEFDVLAEDGETDQPS